MSRLIAAVAIAAASIGGILWADGGAPADAAKAKPRIQKAARLTAFASCERFLQHTRARAIALTGPWGMQGYYSGVMPVDALAGSAPAPAGTESRAAAPAADTAPQQGVDYSGTNVQEEGVDEPDIVKSDGRRMFAVSAIGATITALDVRGGAAQKLGALPLDGLYGAQLLLSGNRLLVIGQGEFEPQPVPAPQVGGSPPSLGVDGTVVVDQPARMIAPVAPQGTILRLVDVSDPANMKVIESLRLEGSFVSARLTGHSVRVVLSTPPEPIAFTSPPDGGVVSQLTATARNRLAVASAGLDTWLPSYRVERGQRLSERQSLVACDDVRRPPQFSGLGMLTVATLDVDRGVTPVDSDSVETDGQIVYGSPSSLYVATPRWVDPTAAPSPDALPNRVTTQIHRFDTASATETRYRGSGSVAGFLLSQWSMSEQAGVLRVASTEQPSWWGPTEEQSESFVTTLQVSDQGLAPMARVGGLGRGERIYAVRFVGHAGYVVTFRQTDPLYVVDVSDAAHPRVKGELKIPGYSAYLHPVGEDLLLGVGQDATLEGRVQGTQISLFDVSDPAKPSRLQHLTFKGAWSEAEADHHAFLYWAPSRLAMIPVNGPDGSGAWSAQAVGVRVGRATGLSQVGKIAHPSTNGAPAQIRRSLVVGRTLYTVSDGGVMASGLDGLGQKGWVALS
jgi:hypothetical protein